MRLLVFVFMVATAGIYLAMVVWSLPYVTAEAGGLMPFDLRPFGYSVQQAEAFHNALSDEGRLFYLNTQLLLDLFFPPMLALCFILIAFVFWQNLARWVIIALALLTLTADYTENVLLAQILTHFDPDLVIEASFWTKLKSGSTTLTLGLIIVMLSVGIWRRKRAETRCYRRL
ncbi:hypothetical protein N4R57_05920 [Rhodobacteraceae bacterium D3-12]|nr:hypothetical protein N4R57_05920 [Rhodobacteraceae bacterium D3-12]